MADPTPLTPQQKASKRLVDAAQAIALAQTRLAYADALTRVKRATEYLAAWTEYNLALQGAQDALGA